MAQQGAKKTVPRLRFPEFRNLEGWAEYNLGEISMFVTERVGTASCTPYTITSGIGLVSQKEKLGRTIAGNSLKNYVVLQTNDFAYNKSATKAFPQGFIARYTGSERAAVPNSIFSCFRVDEEMVSPAFLENQFAANLHGKWLRNRIAVGARAHGSLQVSDDDLMALPVPLPSGTKSLVEQQKITDCLTSLDEVIAAQGRKVEALKAHKRGLMQQLFPREGETRPCLRFPEFQNAPEWHGESLARLGHFLSPLSGKTASDFDCGDAKFIPYSNVFEHAFTDAAALRAVNVSAGERQNSVRKGDVFFTVSSETPADAGMSSVLLEDIDDCYLNSFCALFRFSEASAVDSVFAGYFFRSPPVRSYLASNAQGTIRYNISRSVFQELQLLLPTLGEQRRIAGCLSFVDTQIAAKSSQLAALKTHKQGLMQQLFPASGVG